MDASPHLPLISVLPPSPRRPADEQVHHMVTMGRGSLKFMLGNWERRQRIFRDGVRWEQVFIALADGVPAGFLSFQTRFRSPYAPSFAAFRREYGFRSACWRSAVFRLLDLRNFSHEFYVYGLKVDPQWRQMGIAGRLLEAAEAYARSQGARYISLEVFGTNTAALALYKKHGYSIKEKPGINALGRRLSLPTVFLLRKALQAASAPS